MERLEQLLDLLDRWDERSDSEQSTPEEFCSEHPELLDEFCKLLQQRGVLAAVLSGEQTSALQPEQLVERLQTGRFPAIRFHDSGGLGWVYVARDNELDRTVALKCLQPNPATDPVARKRFLREAEITARLEHPGVVPIYGLGDLTPNGFGVQPFPSYAMRFIQGETLRDVIRQLHEQSTKINWNTIHAVRILRSFVAVCDTIAFAHSRDVIHRDLKSANIMLGAFGETLVLDWGLSKLRSAPTDMDPVENTSTERERDSGMTQAGSALGTVGFMSPEQSRGDWSKVDIASDIFSLGAILYQILTNQCPYTGETALEAAKTCTFEPPQKLKPEVPGPLAAICLKAMQVAPSDRYATAADLKSDIERFLSDEPTVAHPDSAIERLQRVLRKHRSIVRMASLTAIAAIVTLSIFLSVLADRNRTLVLANQREEAATAIAVRERDRANDERDLAKQERARADVKAAEARQMAVSLYRMLEQAQPDQHDGPYLLADWIEESLSSDQFFANLSPAYEGQLRLQLAEMLNQLDRQQQAVPHFRRAITVLSQTGGLFDQAGQARRQLAIILSSNTAGWENYPERFAEAQKLLQENIDSKDVSPGVRRASTNRLAQSLCLEGNVAEAEQVIVKLLKEFESLNPPDPYAHAEAKKYFCHILGLTQRSSEAVPILREIIDHPPEEMPQVSLDETWLQLARCLQASGPDGSTEAIRIYEELFRRHLKRYGRPTHATVLAVARE
jgi:serine/threonine protein kinase